MKKSSFVISLILIMILAISAVSAADLDSSNDTIALSNDAEAIAKAGSSALEAKIEVYELLGAEVYLYFTVEGSNFTARVNPRTATRTGDVTKFAVDVEKIHVFDKETEQVITN